MSDCEGDFKCLYCKGALIDEPVDKFGACIEAELRDEIERLTNVLEYARNEIRDGNKRIAELEAELFTMRNVFHEQDKKVEQLEAVVGVAKEYEKMFARSRAKPYSISNELQALFDALASMENSDE